MSVFVTFPSPVASATPHPACGWNRLACTLLFGVLLVGILPVEALPVGTLPVPAQTANAPSSSGPTAGKTAGSTAVNLGTYKLGPQDVLRVVVENYPNYSHDNVPVLPDGTVNLPFYGQLKVNGKTIPQVQLDLRRRLGRRFVRTEILTVGIVKPRDPEPVKPSTVYVLGAVEKPGSVPIEKGYRLTQVLAAIGGVKGRLDEVQATLTRHGKGATLVDLAMAVTRPSSVANVPVQHGDTLTVAAIEPERVAVAGAVVRPGVFEMHRTPRFGNELPLDPRLLDVLVAAGGVKTPAIAEASPAETVPAGTVPAGTAPAGTVPAEAGQNAADTQIDPSRFTGTILRQGQTIPLRVGEALVAKGGGNNPANVPILAGDFVTVEYVPPKPPVTLTVFVEGSAARQPGTFTVPDGTRVLEVIARAGGLAKPLPETRVSLRRAGSDKLTPIDLQQAFLHDDLQTNPPLQNGDIVMVKEPDTIEVRVTGRFAKPDALQLPIGASLNEAIAAAGGLAIAPDKARLSIVRRLDNGEQRVLQIDPVALLQKHDLSQNTRLRLGDWIDATDLPEERKQTVLLSGEVAKSGAYEIIEGETLTQLIARAGGLTGEALRSEVIVQRGGKTQSVDIYDAVTNGAPLDFPLKDNDFVTVKKNPNRVTVLEAVVKPGPVVMPEKGGITLLDALNAAGGTQPDANKKEILLLRRLPEGAPLQPGAVRPTGLPENVNVQAFTVALDKNVTAAASVPLQAGDVIYVPLKSAKKSVLSSVLPLATLARLFGLGL